MAEAHSAVAFSFSVTPDGLDVNVNHEALRAVWQSGLRSWKKRLGRAKNNFINNVYPVPPGSLFLTLSIVLGMYIAGLDMSCGLLDKIHEFTPTVTGLEQDAAVYASLLLFGLVIWVGIILVLKYILKLLLTYQGWMYEPRGKVSAITKFWVMCLKLMVAKAPLLYSYQGALPKMPVPSLDGTMKRYLRSVRPLMTDEQYNRMQKLVEEFRKGIGKKLQRYLILKSWWATNYVSDWWEEYVYMRGRSPIMVNSNFYGVDAVLPLPTHLQAARAANVVHSILQFRRSIDREELTPIMLNKTIPLCSAQYERQFNTTRVPGIETDVITHYNDAKHIVVLNKGRYFKVYIYYKHQLLSPVQLEIMFQQILDDDTTPAAGEEHLAALTAGDRIPWAKARQQYFCKGMNKVSLDAIEKAAFVLVLDDEPQDFDDNDMSKIDNFGRAMLHGKGYDRWFDKSFNLVICSNGRIGFNAEHGWADSPVMARLWENTVLEDYMIRADAPIMGHAWEYLLAEDRNLGGEHPNTNYGDDGHVIGEAEFPPPNPIRLQWEIPQECQEVISNSLDIATDLLHDVDLHILKHDAYGKGFIKTCKTSPDAYIQMALQLAYYRDTGKFCLTYEASMTRLYREGRTETVRSCTIESCAFVKAMEDRSKTKAERIALLKIATEAHTDGYKDAMTGKGIDRHLFCLYVVSKYLGIESPFLKEVLSEPWRLSTSQTPHQQTNKIDMCKNPNLISAGGGFGPVADDGYGVSYIVAGENVIFFHISSKRGYGETDSRRFGRKITNAMEDIKQLFAKE